MPDFWLEEIEFAEKKTLEWLLSKMSSTGLSTAASEWRVSIHSQRRGWRLHVSYLIISFLQLWNF